MGCSRPAYQEQGYASTVANHYVGRMTSSGQPYYAQGYTAAHTSLPFGTVLKVKNLYTGRTVKVTVNDRFPYYPGRVVNLSAAAANHIGIPYMQLAQVSVVAKSIPRYASHGGGGYGGQPQSQPSYGYAPQPARAPAPAYSQGYPPPQATPPAYYNSAQPYQQPAPAYPQNYGTSAYPSAAPKKAPTYKAPKSNYSVPSAGSGLGAPAYNGGNGPPPGLNTF